MHFPLPLGPCLHFPEMLKKKKKILVGVDTEESQLSFIAGCTEKKKS